MGPKLTSTREYTCHIQTQAAHLSSIKVARKSTHSSVMGGLHSRYVVEISWSHSDILSELKHIRHELKHANLRIAEQW